MSESISPSPSSLQSPFAATTNPRNEYVERSGDGMHNSALAAPLKAFGLTPAHSLQQLFPALRFLGATTDPARPSDSVQAHSKTTRVDILETFKPGQDSIGPFSLNVSDAVAESMAKRTIKALRQAVPAEELVKPMTQLDGPVQSALVFLLGFLQEVSDRVELPQNESLAVQHAQRLTFAAFALIALMRLLSGDEKKWPNVASTSSRTGGVFTPDFCWWKAMNDFGIACIVTQMEHKRYGKVKDVLKSSSASSPASTTSPSPAQSRSPPSTSQDSSPRVSTTPYGRIGPNGPPFPPSSRSTTHSPIIARSGSLDSSCGLLDIPEIVERANQQSPIVTVDCLQNGEGPRKRKQRDGSFKLEASGRDVAFSKLLHVAVNAAPTNKLAIFHDPKKSFFTFFVHLFSSSRTRSSRAPHPELAKLPFLKEAGASHYTTILSSLIDHDDPEYFLVSISSLVLSAEEQQSVLADAILEDPTLYRLFAELTSARLTPQLDPISHPFQLRTGEPLPPDPKAPTSRRRRSSGDEEPREDEEEDEEKDEEEDEEKDEEEDEEKDEEEGEEKDEEDSHEGSRSLPDGANDRGPSSPDRRGDDSDRKGVDEKDGGKGDGKEGRQRRGAEGEEERQDGDGGRNHGRSDYVERFFDHSLDSRIPDVVGSTDERGSTRSSRPSTPRPPYSTPCTSLSSSTPAKPACTTAGVPDSPVSPLSLLTSMPTLAGVEVFAKNTLAQVPKGSFINCTPLPFTPIDEKPEVVQPDSPPSIGSLFLEDRLISSHDYTVFRARLSFEQVNFAVVCKFDLPGAEESGLEWEAQKWSEVEECAGVDAVVPPLVGYFERVEKANEVGGLLVTLRHGERVKGLRALSTDHKQRIYALYERLHAQGLVHNDPGARNVLYDERTDQYRLCDLERSCDSDNTHHELSKVAALLDLPPADSYST